MKRFRTGHEDRVLWIDALCIDQGNPQERGHQVRQMASIYERARQVIFWLGPATRKTNRIVSYMQQLETLALGFGCNDWRPSDLKWRFLWSNVEKQLTKTYGISKSRQRSDYIVLLERPWFNRMWILQEVAKARSAIVMCGTRCVSARIFALTPGLLKVQPIPSRQAVLEIMPGPSRRCSWWLRNQGMGTLIHKFRGSEASDPRDMVYALLGISSDAKDADTLQPDYSKDVQDVVWDTLAFLLGMHKMTHLTPFLPNWSMPGLLNRTAFLREETILWLLREQQVRPLQDPVDAKGLPCDFQRRSCSFGEDGTCECEGLPHVNEWEMEYHQRNGLGTYVLEDDTLRGYGETRNKILVELTYDMSKLDLEYLERRSKAVRVVPLLSWAADRGETTVAKSILASGTVQCSPLTSSNLWSGSTAYRGHAHRSRLEEMPLCLAVQSGHEAMVQLLLNAYNIIVDSKNSRGWTPLALAAGNGHTPTMKILAESGRADVNAKDAQGLTPLSIARTTKREDIAKLLRSYGAETTESSLASAAAGNQ